MNSQELKNLLEKTEDKLNIFTNPEIINQFSSHLYEFIKLINDCLSDTEKLNLFSNEYFQNLNSFRKEQIINSVSDDNIKFCMLSSPSVLSGFSTGEIVSIIKKSSEELKTKILTNQDLVSNVLNLKEYQISNLVETLSSDESKLGILKTTQISAYHIAEIACTLKDENKLKFLSDSDFNKSDIIKILASFEPDFLCDFIDQNKEFFNKHRIDPYEVTFKLSLDKQKELVSKLMSLNLTTAEKKEILATLNSEVKKDLDLSILPKEYHAAVGVETDKYTGRVIIDFDKNPNDYLDLDNIIEVNALHLTKEEKEKFLNLCKICPNLTVLNDFDNILFCPSTVNEYIQAESWIQSIISSLNPEFTPAQKLAVIDTAIGKKISYTPEFGTEVFSHTDSRALWKIISSGYGVCNGVAFVEQYMLNQVGIQSELIGTGGHAFLKIKDIELPLADGSTIKGDTIVDPTWNLSSNRFGGKPQNFCISYEQARKNDIDASGTDHLCHKNDKALQDVTLGLDDKSLRALYTSVGIADKDGQFPILSFLNKSKEIHTTYANNPEEDIHKQFTLLSTTHPDFATCPNSSMAILSGNLLGDSNLQFKKCVVKRVYDRNDKAKKAVLYVYVDLENIGERFYFGDKSTGQMVQISKKDFEEKFECYDTDLKKENGIRPWESSTKQEESKDLSTSSGKIEEDGR